MWNDTTTWNLTPLSPISVRWTQSFASCSEVTGSCGWSWIHALPFAGAWALYGQPQQSLAVASQPRMAQIGIRFTF